MDRVKHESLCVVPLRRVVGDVEQQRIRRAPDDGVGHARGPCGLDVRFRSAARERRFESGGLAAALRKLVRHQRPDQRASFRIEMRLVDGAVGVHEAAQQLDASLDCVPQVGLWDQLLVRVEPEQPELLQPGACRAANDAPVVLALAHQAVTGRQQEFDSGEDVEITVREADLVPECAVSEQRAQQVRVERHVRRRELDWLHHVDAVSSVPVALHQVVDQPGGGLDLVPAVARLDRPEVVFGDPQVRTVAE